MPSGPTRIGGHRHVRARREDCNFSTNLLQLAATKGVRVSIPRQPPERTALYRLYNASGELLYIGISKHPELRFEEHRMAGACWVVDVARRDFTWHLSRPEALAAEKAAIQSERPRYNGTYNYDDAPMPTDWRPVNGKNKTAQVAHFLRAEIESGRWGPEQRIPELRRLAAAAGVAMRTVGVAVKTLKTEGLLESRAGNGLFVAGDDSWMIPASKYADDGRLFHDWTYDHLG